MGMNEEKRFADIIADGLRLALTSDECAKCNEDHSPVFETECDRCNLRIACEEKWKQFWLIISLAEAQCLHDSMEGCCDRAGMDLIREILARFSRNPGHVGPW